MENIVVTSSTHQYPIYIGKNIFPKLGEIIAAQYSSILIITDEHVANLYLKQLIQSIRSDETIFTAIIPAGEQSKSIHTFYDLHTKAIQYGLDRKSLIIALGGGVVGDLSGFVASTYMRGIDYIQLPTTILAHDSSVGGKVAINHDLGKNLIGNFYAPKLVLFDVKTLTTLPEQEIRSGYAELMKEALLGDEKFFLDLLTTDVKQLNSDMLAQHLQKGIKIKAQIVEQDEKEANIRKFLNLGHTLAHAIEVELEYGTITHGEAVAIGLLFALYVSERYLDVKLPVKEVFNWFNKNNYPIQLTNINPDHLLQIMKIDKKAVNKHVQMVLLEEVARPIVKEINDNQLQIYLHSFLNDLTVR